MNKVLIYGASILAICSIAWLSYSDPKNGAIASLVLIIGGVIIGPKIRNLKASKDGIEINEEPNQKEEPKSDDPK